MPYEKVRSLVRFTHESASAVVQLDKPGVGFVIGVFSHERNRGHATGLMNEIIQWADENRMILELVAMTYIVGKTRGTLTTPQLVEFYRKFGFTSSSDAISMRRIFVS